MIPLRLQYSRKRGFHLFSPNGLENVRCCRPGKYGNPYKVGSTMYVPNRGQVLVLDKAHAVELFRANAMDLVAGAIYRQGVIQRLTGTNLCCWCKLCPKHAHGKPLDEQCPDCAPCHTDVIAEILYPQAGNGLEGRET